MLWMIYGQGIVRVHCTDMDIEVLNKVEIDKYCDHCMTLRLCTIAR